MKSRKEYDSIGFIKVPGDKYWGASTQRSKKYFDIGEFLVRAILIQSIAIIKKSAAIVHKKEKQIEVKIANAIMKHQINPVGRYARYETPNQCFQTSQIRPASIITYVTVA